VDQTPRFLYRLAREHPLAICILGGELWWLPSTVSPYKNR
jgi:hypothetical protein